MHFVLTDCHHPAIFIIGLVSVIKRFTQHNIEHKNQDRDIHNHVKCWKTFLSSPPSINDYHYHHLTGLVINTTNNNLVNHDFLQTGQTALSIAQKLGYISVVETLKVGSTGNVEVGGYF